MIPAPRSRTIRVSARLLPIEMAVLVVVLSGCMTAIRPPSPRASVEVRDSSFESSVTVLGIERTIPGNEWSPYFLRSWIDKQTGEVTHQLYVNHIYSGEWIFWDRANDQEAHPLEFTQISRDVIACGAYTDCSYSEHFAATLDDDRLRALAGSYYSVKFYAQTGREMIITLTPEQIDAQLAAVAAYR